ncbi:MAG TPA: ATPase domain-containing protein [Nitrososphaerales archaeon]|nr:ATPase domain-containing protein [Nitrososphaerales archaeon]
MISSRVKTGVPELDKMLNGGFLRGDAVMLAGNAGTGKTTLALHYLLNGVEAGESGIYVTFEQLPDQLYKDALSFGWDLRKLEEQDKLRVVCTSPNVILETGGENVLDEFIKEIRPRRIVIDSLSHLQMFVGSGDLRMEAYRLIMYLKTKGLSSLLIWEVPQMVGQSLSVTDVGLSFLVDSIVLLRFVEIASSLKLAVVVVKSRGSPHDDSLKRFSITQKGLVVGSQFQGYESLLSGAPRKIEEATQKLHDWLAVQPVKVAKDHFERMCSEVFSLEGIRYAAVRDAVGNTLAGGQKPGVQVIQSEEEERDTFYRVSLLSGALAAMPESFGRPEVLSIRLKNIQLVVVPLGGGNVLFGTTTPDTPTETIDRIVKIVMKFSA